MNYQVLPTGVPTLTPVGAESNIQSIAAGTQSSMVLTDASTLYTWGLNLNGQLGQGDYTNRIYPTLIPSYSSASTIGPYTTANLISSTNEVYDFTVMGDNSVYIIYLPVLII